MRESGALELETRRRVHAAVRGYPGAHVAELARIAGLESNHARYHLERLAAAGLVTARPEAGFTRYFPRTEGAHDAHGAWEKRLLAALRRPASLRIVLALVEARAALALRDIAARVRSAPSTASYHLDRLVSEEIVLRQGATPAERAYALAEPTRVERMLVENPPRRDLVAGFIELFDGLALRQRE